jgi:hypothetical protein
MRLETTPFEEEMGSERPGRIVESTLEKMMGGRRMWMWSVVGVMWRVGCGLWVVGGGLFCGCGSILGDLPTQKIHYVRGVMSVCQSAHYLHNRMSYSRYTF